MRNLVKAVLLFGTLGVLTIQAQDLSIEVRKEVSKFDFIIGKWEGDGWAYNQQGVKENTHILEDIQFDLDQTIIVMRGSGTSQENGQSIKSHDALGVLSFDVFQEKFKINSWIHKGMSTTAKVEYKSRGNFVWWFEAGPNMTMRYTVTIKEGSWNEVGEMSTDGLNWRQFFEMNLTKVSD